MGKRFRELFVDRSDVTAGFFDSIADTVDALSARLAQAEQERDEARADYDALADDALSLLDQHLSAEVRRETQMRIVDRLADKR
jgi:outer membrane murein-binding lipoprotein Lpp